MITSKSGITKIQAIIIAVILVSAVVGAIYYQTMLSNSTPQPLSKVSTPSFSPPSGNYSSTQNVALSCATSGASIRYTTNGSEPSSSSALYSSPISISSTTTVKAKAFMSGMTDSDTAQATYTITAEPQPLSNKVSTPTFFPRGGVYYSSLDVELSCATSGATIRYTVDGSEPSSSSAVYSSPILISSSITIKAKAFVAGMNDSDTALVIYSIIIPIKVATPTFSPVGGSYDSAQSVVINCSTPGATIRYTTNGVEPTSSSTEYSEPILVSSTTTVKAKAFMNDMTDSDTASATYTININ